MENKNKDKYKVGDFVVIKETDSSNKTLGKIEEIFKENNEILFRYNEFYFPEKTQSKMFS
jgi:hypothetical protein